ncbi:MAG: cation-transporting P-type ATPase [bacterium]|nr:cation-transporting P-type ATPase [bacterium]
MGENKTKQISLPAKQITEWYKLGVAAVAAKLSTDTKMGLSRDEAARRFKAFGPNKLPEEDRDDTVKILLRQVRSPLVYILIFAAFLSLSLQHYADLSIIAVVILANVLVGYYQEHRANTTLAELQKVVKDKAAVLRDGVVKEIESANVVSGDVIRIMAGDRVPADARLIECQDLEVIEAALTGESFPSLKSYQVIATQTSLGDQDNMVFMGTSVVAGVGYAVVVATGEKTELGRVVTLVRDVEQQPTPLQRGLTEFSAWVAWATLALGFIVLLVGIAYKKDFFEMLLTAVAVAVAVIPEGLLISLTMILAVGMQRILRKRGLVRHLSSAETLGATSVICMDKTGTLTLGEMRLAALVSASEEFRHRPAISERTKSQHLLFLLKATLLVNEAIVENPEKGPLDWKILGNQTDRALLVAAAELDFYKSQVEKEFSLLDQIPFNEKRKYAASLRKANASQNEIYIKGAAEIVLSMCRYVDVLGKQVPITHPSVAHLKKRVDEMTGEGLRLLAVARKKVSSKVVDLADRQVISEFTLLGFVGLHDPVRPEVAGALLDARAAGLRPVIITGDHKLTTMCIARELGLEISDREAVEGSELDQMDDATLQKRAPEIKIYARVTPAHKLRIIEAWQARGEVVAMTGDGVNDAPALKKANIGMSLGSGTKVAQAASDLVLLDNNFKTIVAAIEQGRIIYNNIRRVILYLLSDSFSAVILIIGSLLLKLPIPLLPAQILWNNLVTDGPPNMALTFEPGDSDVMKVKPRRRDEPLINSEMKFIILFVGIVTDLIFLGLFFALIRQLALAEARTVVFVAFGFSSLLYAFSLKNLRKPLWRIPLFNNWWLIGTVALGIILQLLAIYWSPLQALLGTVPLSLALWGWVAVLSSIKLLAIELAKIYFRARSARLTPERAQL